ncbi:MAG TPA: amidohydrolase [Bryobacteraceae bacterium]|nr:amidohydrolase [Bryobacteraceae bacterium]
MKRILILTLATLAPAADLVLRNGKIVTLDLANPQVQAIAITAGKIVAVGTDAQIASQVQPSTKVIDLAGKLAIPGFIDGHGHFTGVGQMKMNLNLRDAKSWDQIVAMVGAAAKEAKPGQWIVGRGWHQEKWDAKPVPNVNGFPVHDALSKAAPNNPVILTHASGHGVFVNLAAMKAAGITRDTPNPPGGEIMKDASGNPIGMMNERAQGLLREAMNRDLAKRSAADREADEQRQIDLAAQESIEQGVTTFHDAGSPADVIERFKRRAAAGTLPLRLYVMLREPNDAVTRDAPRLRMIGFGDNHLTVRAIKRQIDGALGTRGAWLLAPYSDLPSTSGSATEDPADIEKTAQIAIAAGYQLCVHAIGDRANREVLNIYERTFKANPDKNDLRWRIEHAQHIDPSDIPRFAQLGVIASMQTVHATSDGPMVLPRLGETRAREGAYAWQSLMKSGAHVSNGTDAPVEEVNPIANFYAAVTRKMKNGQPFYPDQKMSRMEALQSYTVEPAYAAFEENLKGRLKTGMLGDITVLSQDILTVPEDDIMKTHVEYTIVGGKIAYQRVK